jgi:hypothetical protein
LIALAELARVHLDWGQPTAAELHWLFRQGVRLDAMCSPWRIGAAHVRFDGHTFELDPTGERCISFVIFDRGEPIDIAAWSPKTGKLGTWRGVAFALGQDAIFNPATYFGANPLRIHNGPLEWLKAGRDGIVIVQPKYTYAYLRNVRRASFADPALAQHVQSWIQPPQPRTELFIETPAEMAE